MRTIMWFLSFGLTLIATLPKLRKARRMEKNNELDKLEKYVHEESTKWKLGNIKRSGAKIEVIGLQNLPEDETVVYISNHQGNFDIPILMSYIPRTKGFISKIEARKIPIIVDWMELLHCIFMDRSTLKGSAGAIIDGIKTLKNGHSLVIFPEGTRSKGDKMGEFKVASFKLATKPGITIIPVTINGSYKLMEFNNNKIKPAEVKLTIHEPIRTKGLTKDELEILPDKIRQIISSALPNQ